MDSALLKSLQKDADKAAFSFKELEDTQQKVMLYLNILNLITPLYSIDQSLSRIDHAF